MTERCQLEPGDILWSAYMAEDQSGCYASPHRVRVCKLSRGKALVQEHTSYGWSSWRSARKTTELFNTEREAWRYLVSRGIDLTHLVNALQVSQKWHEK